VKHCTSPQFWECYNRLPVKSRRLADDSFQLLKSNPKHPSLHLKKVERYWSVRIGLHHRALAVLIEDGFLWFWIGNHSEYDRMIKAKL
jgi:hypothetical protein